jgi:hypothetical protein
MKASPALGVVLLSATSLLAGPETIIKQRAKELSNQNNVRQGVPPPTQAPSARNAAPTPPPQSPNITHLRSELASIKAGAITDDQKEKLAQALLAAAETAGKPSAESVKALAGDVAAAFGQKPLSPEVLSRFVTELDAVLNPSKYPKAKLDGIIADIQAIFQANDLPRKDAAKIADDVKAVAAEVRK